MDVKKHEMECDSDIVMASSLVVTDSSNSSSSPSCSVIPSSLPDAGKPKHKMVERTPYDMRFVNIANLAKSKLLSSQFSSAPHIPGRLGGRCLVGASKSLDLLRRNIQSNINKDIDAVIKGYLEKFFKPAIRNIRNNLGNESVTDEHVRTVCCNILEDARQMYCLPAPERPCEVKIEVSEHSEYKFAVPNSESPVLSVRRDFDPHSESLRRRKSKSRQIVQLPQHVIHHPAPQHAAQVHPVPQRFVVASSPSHASQGSGHKIRTDASNPAQQQTFVQTQSLPARVVPKTKSPIPAPSFVTAQLQSAVPPNRTVVRPKVRVDPVMAQLPPPTFMAPSSPDGMLSGRITPNKGRNTPVIREGPKWDPNRIIKTTKFVMGARANKVLGFCQTRGRLYIKHPELFRYSGDQEDKDWLARKNLMPPSGGKAYLMVVDDIRELAESEEYRNNPNLMLHELVGFEVPEFILKKIRAFMSQMRADAPEKQPTQDIHISTGIDVNFTTMQQDQLDLGLSSLPSVTSHTVVSPTLVSPSVIPVTHSVAVLDPGLQSPSEPLELLDSPTLAAALGSDPFEDLEPFDGDLPLDEDMPLDGEIPLDGELPLDSDLPLDGDLSLDGDLPLDNLTFEGILRLQDVSLGADNNLLSGSQELMDTFTISTSDSLTWSPEGDASQSSLPALTLASHISSEFTQEGIV